MYKKISLKKAFDLDRKIQRNVIIVTEIVQIKIRNINRVLNLIIYVRIVVYMASHM